MINPLWCFFGIKDHLELDINLGPNTIPYSCDLDSACPHRKFHTLPGLLRSRAVLPRSYPDACMPSREAVCTIFMKVFGLTQSGCEPTTYPMTL